MNLKDVNLKIGNSGYFAFLPHSIKNDGTFNFWHERFNMPEHVEREDITPRIVEKNMFWLFNNLDENNVSSYYRHLNLYRNAISINRIPVWNNTISIQIYALLNHYQDRFPDGQVLLQGKSEGIPFKVILKESDSPNLMNNLNTYEFVFQPNGELKVTMNAQTIKTIQLGYSSLTELTELKIGDEEQNEIDFYYFQVSNHSIESSYTSSYKFPQFFENLYTQRNLGNPLSHIPSNEKIDLTDRFFVPRLEIAVSGWGESDKPYISYLREGYIRPSSIIDEPSGFLHYDKLYAHEQSNILFVNWEKNSFYYPKISPGSISSWRFYSGEKTFLKVDFKEWVVTSFIFTILEPVDITNTCLFEIRRIPQGNYDAVNFVNEEPRLKFYWDRIEYTNRENVRKIVNISQKQYLPHYLSRNEVSFIPKLDDQNNYSLEIYINGFKLVTINDYNFDVPHKGGSYILFNGSPERESIFLDLHGVYYGESPEIGYNLKRDIHNNFVSKKVNIISSFIESFIGEPSFILENESTKRLYSFNQFNNIDSDGVVKSLKRVSDAIYKLNWESITSYISLPLEWQKDEALYIKRMDENKTFVERKISTRKLTDIEVTANKDIFDLGTFKAINSRYFGAFYANYYKDVENDNFDEIKDGLVFRKNASHFLKVGTNSYSYVNNSGNVITESLVDQNLSSFKLPFTYLYLLSPVSNSMYSVATNGVYTEDSHYLKKSNNSFARYVLQKYLEFSFRENEALTKELVNRVYHIGGHGGDASRWINHYSVMVANEFTFFTFFDCRTYNMERLKQAHIKLVIKYEENNSLSLNNFLNYNVIVQGEIVNNTNYGQTSYDVNRNYVTYDFDKTPESLEEFKEDISSQLPYVCWGGSLIDAELKASNDFRIYGTVSYDGFKQENMKISLVAGNAGTIYQTYTNETGFYEFRDEMGYGYFRVVCEDPTQKYNLQVKDYTIYEKHLEGSYILKNQDGKHAINYPALIYKKGI